MIRSQYKSPYREVGLAATDVTRQNRQRKKEPGPHTNLVMNPAERRVSATGHRFPIITDSAAARRGSSVPYCSYCHQPRYAVESKKCPRRPR